jgi:enoyl-CoA hydratase
MKFETIECESHDGVVATIWLSRPESLIAVSSVLAREGKEALKLTRR